MSTVQVTVTHDHMNDQWTFKVVGKPTVTYSRLVVQALIDAYNTISTYRSSPPVVPVEHEITMEVPS